jgi:hypothetical protein
MTKNEAASCITGHILCPMLGTTGYTYCSELTFEKGGIVQLIYFAKKNEWILMSAQENILIVTQEP